MKGCVLSKRLWPFEMLWLFVFSFHLLLFLICYSEYRSQQRFESFYVCNMTWTQLSWYYLGKGQVLSGVWTETSGSHGHSLSLSQRQLFSVQNLTYIYNENFRWRVSTPLGGYSSTIGGKCVRMWIKIMKNLWHKVMLLAYLSI